MMTFDYWCVFFAFIFPYILVTLAKAGCSGYDNHAPRPYMDKLINWRKRSYWAQLNGFEAFAPFAAGVIIAHQAGVAPTTLNYLAGAFVLSRIAHAVFYITNQAALRSLVWLVGFGATIGLFTSTASL